MKAQSLFTLTSSIKKCTTERFRTLLNMAQLAVAKRRNRMCSLPLSCIMVFSGSFLGKVIDLYKETFTVKQILNYT